MTKEYVEKEIKVKVNDTKKVKELLKKHGGKYKGKSFQRTIRFDTPNLNYEKKGTFIRVRSGHGNTVTLKKKVKKNILLITFDLYKVAKW